MAALGEARLDYVNPFIGTGGHGHTFPGATVPFGMIQLSPSNKSRGWDWVSGYHYSDTGIKGFAHTHLSGTGIGGLGDILVMPTHNFDSVDAGSDDDLRSGYRSAFSHDQESASPGYYSVKLLDYDIDVELTAAARVGFHRYTFNRNGDNRVVIDPSHFIAQPSHETHIEVLSDTTIRGYRRSIRGDGQAGPRTAYFYAEFSTPFRARLFDADNAIEAQSHISRSTKALLDFDLGAGDTVELKLALSFASADGAKENFETEARDQSFDGALVSARKQWAEKLSKIDISGTHSQKVIFYTGMYHSFIAPNLISDVNGDFRVQNQSFNTDYPQYSNYSTWDTFRTLHPMYSLIEQSQNKALVQSMISRHAVSKLELPKWEMNGHDNRCMPGYSMVPVIADAVLKGMPGIDNEAAYQAIRHAAFGRDRHSPNYGRDNGMDEYLDFGYIDASVGSSLAKMPEYNYYDGVIAQVAKRLAKDEDAAMFESRSLSFMHMFETETGFLWPRESSGEWAQMQLDNWDSLNRHYISGNIWAYSTFAPHAMPELVNLHGGAEAFGDKLDRIFNETTPIGGKQHVDISGFIGRYSHGDEPAHHMAFLYNYIGQGYKTQERVRQILTSFYGDDENGLDNNEDMGQMSAWYIMAALGIYPVDPSAKQYILTSPLHSYASLNLEDGKRFTITTDKDPMSNPYIERVTLNGKDYAQAYITHETILAGGELVFYVNDTPNKQWAASSENWPVRLNEPRTPPSIKHALSPFDADVDKMFVTSREISLNTNTQGASMFYTLDGSEPSQQSIPYTGAFSIDDTTTLKTIAFHEQLAPSKVLTRTYVKSALAGLSQGYPEITLRPEPTRFGDKKGRFLIDGEFATKHARDGRWTAVRGSDLIIEMVLGEHTSFEYLSLSTLIDVPRQYQAPAKIEVFGSDEQGNEFSLGMWELETELSAWAHQLLPIRIPLQNDVVNAVRIKMHNYGSRTPDKPSNFWVSADEIVLN
ncbi:GH92 family glycosyl hydrolase [Ningiella sp. W23]|uniref:GH92 family glycosyl hydrolase n=1 Tax=Ningiella sp. W23 TaxID=3023715 RepID=UPI003756663C